MVSNVNQKREREKKIERKREYISHSMLPYSSSDGIVISLLHNDIIWFACCLGNHFIPIVAHHTAIPVQNGISAVGYSRWGCAVQKLC